MVEQPMRQRVAGTAGNTAAEVPSSAWSPFRHAAFTVLWIATVVANVGSWMYNAASSMTALTSRTEISVREWVGQFPRIRCVTVVFSFTVTMTFLLLYRLADRDRHMNRVSHN